MWWMFARRLRHLHTVSSNSNCIFFSFLLALHNKFYGKQNESIDNLVGNKQHPPKGLQWIPCFQFPPKTMFCIALLQNIARNENSRFLNDKKKFSSIRHLKFSNTEFGLALLSSKERMKKMPKKTNKILSLMPFPYFCIVFFFGYRSFFCFCSSYWLKGK